MKISARVTSRNEEYAVEVRTGDRDQTIAIAPKPEGLGSSVNGGEFLSLALATCYCNDLYREAKKRNMEIIEVEVEVSGEFGAEGEPARAIAYRASVVGRAPREALLELMRHTDTVAEIQNTIRLGLPVVLGECEAREA